MLLDDDWEACNVRTSDYYRENAHKIKDNQDLELNLNDKARMEGKTVRDLLYDFAIRFKRGEIYSPQDYFQLLEKSDNIRLLVNAS